MVEGLSCVTTKKVVGVMGVMGATMGGGVCTKEGSNSGCGRSGTFRRGRILRAPSITTIGGCTGIRRVCRTLGYGISYEKCRRKRSRVTRGRVRGSRPRVDGSSDRGVAM